MLEWISKHLFKTKSDIVEPKNRIRKDFVVLIVLDGFGVHPNSVGNAVIQAKTPFLDRVWTNGISTLINASGTYVGLPKDEAGNSEVCHLTIGTGKVIQQSLTKINESIINGKFNDLPVLKEAFEEVKKRGSNLHLMGILSAGGVHGHIDHLFKLMELAKTYDVNPYIHVFLDGRDTGLTDGYFYTSKLVQKIKELGIGKIASMCGRFYSMDRDNRWERTQMAYDCMVGIGKRKAEDPFGALQEAYKNGENDQVFVPTTMVNDKGKPIGAIKDNDVAIFFNFREDRARQITKAFVLPEIEHMNRPDLPKNLFFVTMTGYEDDLNTKVLFQPKKIDKTLASVISDNEMNQIHISETEKYAHVTYFFNGGVELKHKGEDFYNIPSPRVFDYAKTPEMSAELITDQVIYVLKNLKKRYYSFILINYANPDMLGHTGDINATIRSNEYIDDCVRKVVEESINAGGCVVLTADHGNCETMLDRVTMKVDTAHENSPVPFTIISEKGQLEQKLKNDRKIGIFEEEHMAIPTGMLADIAPTILGILGIEKPDSMDGEDLMKIL